MLSWGKKIHAYLLKIYAHYKIIGRIDSDNLSKWERTLSITRELMEARQKNVKYDY